MGEITKIQEISEAKNPDSEKYREIKPEGDITVEDARNFINDIFDGLDNLDIEEKNNPERRNNGYYSTYEERINCTPVENGKWTGERGESKFISTSDEVSQYLKEINLDGVNYKDGCPDFKPFAKGEVEIPSMSTERHTALGKPGNFEQADTVLAQQRGDGCSPRDVANWRKENGYTWHELNDMKTCQKVPISVNKVYRHLGGVSECKRRDDIMYELRSDGGIFDE